MWETQHAEHLSREMPCRACGHEAHRFLPCSDECDCVPPPPPGSLDEPLLVGAGRSA